MKKVYLWPFLISFITGPVHAVILKNDFEGRVTFAIQVAEVDGRLPIEEIGRLEAGSQKRIFTLPLLKLIRQKFQELSSDSALEFLVKFDKHPDIGYQRCFIYLSAGAPDQGTLNLRDKTDEDLQDLDTHYILHVSKNGLCKFERKANGDLFEKEQNGPPPGDLSLSHFPFS